MKFTYLPQGKNKIMEWDKTSFEVEYHVSVARLKNISKM